MVLLRSYIVLVVLILIIKVVHSEQHTVLSLNTAHQQSLNQTSLTARYVFKITQEDVAKAKQAKWYFFVEVEPDQSEEWRYTKIELSVSKKDEQDKSKVVRSCEAKKGGVDSCFLTNSQFSYKEQIIHARVKCYRACKFKISASISITHKLNLEEKVQIDFKDAAASKVFTLNTTQFKGKGQLRIIVRPKTYLQFPAPISLYVNKNNNNILPTRQKHDHKSITLWDNGLGVFIESSESSGFFTILVQGPQRNILILQSFIISEEVHHTLPIDIPFDDFLKKQQKRSYVLSINSSVGVSIQMTTFSGAVRIQKLFDENDTEIVSQLLQQERAFGQVQYLMTPAVLKKLAATYKLDKTIILEVQASKESTFVISYHQLNQSITQLVPQRNRYAEIQPNTRQQYYIELTILDLPQFKKQQFQLIFRRAKDLKIEFFSCKTFDITTCEASKDLVQPQQVQDNNLTKILDYSVELFRNDDEVLGHSFSFDKFNFKGSQNGTRRYVFVILVTNLLDHTKFYSTQYINYGKNIYLRQNQVRNDRVLIDQSKYYAFTNRDQDVQTIRIHVMEISGSVLMKGYLEDPRNQYELKLKPLMNYRNTIRYQKVKARQTIYLQVTGLESSYYSIQLQLIKERQRQWQWPNTTRPITQVGYNQILLSSNIPYQFSLEPKSREVYQIHANESMFLLQISSSLPVEFCFTENEKLPPFDPNCKKLQKGIKNGIYNMTLQVGKKANIGIINNQDKQIKFKIKYTYPNKNSSQGNNTDPKCFPGRIDHINKFNILKGMMSCYSFFPEKYEQMELTIDVVSDQYNKVTVLADINGIEKVQILGTHHIFYKEELQKICNGQKMSCPIKIWISSQIDSEIRFALQYTSGPFFLLDGLASQFSGIKSSKNIIFDLYNKANTTIILQNKLGYYKFYGKIVQSNDYYQKKTTFPTSKDKLIESANPFYNKYEIFILDEQKIHAVNCTECLLLLTVQKGKEEFNEESGKFIIECTQQDRFIKEGRSVVSYISKKSLQFYEYYNSQKGLLLVTINTQNQLCAAMYMIKGVGSRASAQNNDRVSEPHNKNILIYSQAEIGSYSITVQGYENCYYSLDITSSAQNFRIIEKGLVKDISLIKNENFRFVYQNNDNETIKLLTLHQNGEIQINVKTYKNLKEVTEDKNRKPKYTWTGRDFLKINKTDKHYCNNCVYLIVVTAERQTRSSLLISSAQSFFPLTIDSSIKDELITGEKETLRIFTLKKIIFEINVHYGEIKVQKSMMNNETIQFSKKYLANQSTQYQQLEETNQKDNNSYQTYMRYSIITIEALKDSSFSFGLISNMDKNKRGNNIKYGIPQYIMLTQGKQHCVYGTLDDDSEQFLISITGEQQSQLMRNIILTFNVEEKPVKLMKQIAINEMMVKIVDTPKGLPKTYQFCFLSSKSVYFTFIQSSKLNYLDQNKRLIVRKAINLTFYSEGSTLIEINQCTSRAITTISQSLSDIDGFSSQINQIRKSNNIIEFLYFGPIFMNVKAQGATVSWRKKNIGTGQGLGYDEYSVDRMRLNKYDDNNIQIEIFPLKKIAEKGKVTLKTEEEIYLYNAINCNSGLYINKSLKVVGNQINNVVSIQIPIADIASKFKDRKYVLIAVLANAESNIKNDANYRFIYNYMQLPLSVLINPPAQPTTYVQNLMYKYLVYLIVLCLLFFCLVWAYRKWMNKKQSLSRNELRSGDVRYEQFSNQN